MAIKIYGYARVSAKWKGRTSAHQFANLRKIFQHEI